MTKKVFIILFSIIYMNLTYSQRLFPIYNPSDSTFTFTFSQSLDIAKTKKEKVLLEKEVKILNDMGGQNEKLIKKLIYKDSLSQIEIGHHEKMNQLLIIKIDNTNLIVDAYQKNLNEVQTELENTKKNLRREKFWKNFYKFGTPALGAIVFFVLR